MTFELKPESEVATFRGNASLIDYDPQNAEWHPPSMMSVFARGETADAKKAEWKARCAAWLEANRELARDWDEALKELEDLAELRRSQARIRATLMSARAPERCIREILDIPDDTSATEAVKTLMASDKMFLLLSGSPGCGKTLAACMALREPYGMFARAVEVSRFSLFDRADRDAFDSLKRARVLVLDDLGAEMLHDGWRPALDELIDVRYGAMRKTILTTNLPPTSEDEAKVASFRGRYGSRIADRIRHDGFVEKCGDKSLRVRP